MNSTLTLMPRRGYESSIGLDASVHVCQDFWRQPPYGVASTVSVDNGDAVNLAKWGGKCLKGPNPR